MYVPAEARIGKSQLRSVFKYYRLVFRREGRKEWKTERVGMLLFLVKDRTVHLMLDSGSNHVSFLCTQVSGRVTSSRLFCLPLIDIVLRTSCAHFQNHLRFSFRSLLLGLSYLVAVLLFFCFARSLVDRYLPCQLRSLLTHAKYNHWSVCKLERGF